MLAVLPGSIIKILVKSGDQVEEGQGFGGIKT